MDVRTVGTVINFDMPLNVIDYLHRIGRTGRGGAPGVCRVQELEPVRCGRLVGGSVISVGCCICR